MSRFLTTAAQAEADAQFNTLILMGKFEFSEPVYVHTGIGEFVYDSNTYMGVGQFANIGEARESEFLSPLSVDVSLAAPNAQYMVEALDAGNYGDAVTIYAAYRGSDGDIVADPWVVYSGTFEFATIKTSNENIIAITLQHDLSVLDETNGLRFTDEDQQVDYSGDVGFEFVHRQATLRLIWGGRTVQYGGTNDNPAPPGYEVP